MRITGGEWRGHPLLVPDGLAVRPTQDRVREALFSMLQTVIANAVVLDLFAGSGAVGLEALSRGAGKAVFVEQAPRHAAILKRNIDNLKAAARCEIVKADAYTWIATAGTGREFDLVYADPPYELGAQRGYGEMLKTLAEKKVLKVGGIFIAEMKHIQDPETSPGWELLRDRTYGQTRLAIYTRIQ